MQIKNTKSYLFSILLLISIQMVSQNILVLEKYNHKRNHKYTVDNRINLILNKQRVISGIITNIQDSSIVIDGLSHIRISDIKYVVRKRHGFYQMWNLFFKKIALGYFAITTINRTIRDERPIFNTTNMIVVGSAAIIGIIGKFLYVKKYRIDNTHWRLYSLISYDLSNKKK